MEITITTAPVGARWFVFADSVDLEEWDEEQLVLWKFVGKDASTGSMIAVNDDVFGQSLKTDPRTGKMDAVSHAYAYNVQFAKEHLTRIEGPTSVIPGGISDNPSIDQIKALPRIVLASFVRRADDTQGFTEAEIAHLKKPKPATT